MKSAAFFLTLASTVAFADVDPRFAKLRDQAEALGGLSGFIEKYVGDCGSKLLGGAECEKNAKAYREGATGKKFYMIVTEETAQVLSMGEMRVPGEFIMNVTPFFAGGSFGLTHGAPAKTDANGSPVMPYLRIDSVLPDGWNPAMMARQAAAQGLRMQIVFTPQGTWALPRKGGGQIKGVKARFDAILITVGRTGEQVGIWFNK